ncbi:MAG: polyphosphate polymerase domain-containing protein [Oscillospiraceae bacterium]|jgi:hypothetical protein|nr:polyphosphate polymerase domain-containing protein [Oscillospiraceae bacterium]
MAEIFNRYEKKYLITDEMFDELTAVLSGAMTGDKYNKDGFVYPICNIYYDTPDDNLIRRSLAKPKYKEKVRLRAYGVPDGADKVFVEIKKKYLGSVNKRRAAMPLNEAYNLLEKGELPDIVPKKIARVAEELKYASDNYGLVPKVCLFYERYALFDKDNANFRVSFDRNIIARRTDLRLESGIYGERLLDEGYWLMEVKTRNAFPLWFTKLLSEHKIYPVSFSKYGTEYKQMLRNTIHERELCRTA